VEEWGKRMLLRMNVDEYVAAAVKAYESKLTQEDLNEFITLLEGQQAGRSVGPSVRFQQKMTAIAPALTGQIVGATTELGARLGSEIGVEIEKEHPEYFQKAAEPGKVQ
jgi:hypothetical protein